MLYSFLTDNTIVQQTISGICSINRNINHFAVPYIKKYITTEFHEIKTIMIQIINTIKYSQHHTIY